ncbi:MAG: hypothetical protein HWD92_07810 [Flavobacteriia bacterium]|nr:hypothetical protein [Flavobacteriia bacterium]
MLRKTTFQIALFAVATSLLSLSWVSFNQECEQSNVRDCQSSPAPTQSIKTTQPTSDRELNPVKMPEFVVPDTPVQRHELVMDHVIISPANAPVIV